MAAFVMVGMRPMHIRLFYRLETKLSEGGTGNITFKYVYRLVFRPFTVKSMYERIQGSGSIAQASLWNIWRLYTFRQFHNA